MNSHRIKRVGLLWFTLVELIVVITILAILATIAFLSFSWYSSTARDSARVTDIGSLVRAATLFQVKSGFYPPPTSGTGVTFSGGTIWTQGSVGESVFRALALVSKKPVDPLTGKEYTYSVLSTGREFQFYSPMEGDVAYQTPELMPDMAYAADGTPEIVYIKWNYNGIVLKYTKAGVVCVLPVPSLILKDITSSTDLTPFSSANGRLLYDRNSVVQTVTYTPTEYCDTALPDSDAKIQSMVQAIKDSYSGSSIAGSSNISSVISASGAASLNAGKSIITNYLSGKATPLAAASGGGSWGGGWGTCATNPGYAHATFVTGSPSSANTSWQNTVSTDPCYFSCDPTYAWDTASSTCKAAVVGFTNIDGSATSYIPDGANGSSRFTANVGNTVTTDAITGLQWQSYKNPTSPDYAQFTATPSWASAKVYCENLVLDGNSDWRMPDATELESLLDYSKATDPAIDTIYFSSRDNYWSSTSDPQIPSLGAHWVSFKATGNLWAHLNSGSKTSTSAIGIRCVRGSKSSVLPWQWTPSGTFDTNHNVGSSFLAEARFSLLSSNTVTKDAVTGLMWQSYKNSSSADYLENPLSAPRDWNNANSYCQNLSLGGYTDWRLPSVKELMSIGDHTSYTAFMLDSGYFGWLTGQNPVNSQMPIYWTSTIYAPSTTMAWWVSIGYHPVATNLQKSGMMYVRCVR